ncbi:MAG: motif putative anchor domain protein [Lacunisphaera sp.]|nr:motif putative anchor domain protein [Lacunisphaera sp.]
MMNRLLRLPLILSALGLAGTAAAQTNLLLNGSFESGTLGNGYFDGTGVGATALITDWEYLVTGANQHFVVYQGGPAQDGVRNLRLNEDGGGTPTNALFQNFTATLGQTYTATVWAEATNGATPMGLRLAVQSADGLTTYGFANATISGATYVPVTFDFVAPETALRFLILDNTGYDGPGTDLIVDSASLTVSAVPEPSTYAAFAGLGALGFVWFRRRGLHARQA